jgi:hypothetical protein
MTARAASSEVDRRAAADSQIRAADDECDLANEP